MGGPALAGCLQRLLVRQASLPLPPPPPPPRAYALRSLACAASCWCGRFLLGCPLVKLARMMIEAVEGGRVPRGASLPPPWLLHCHQTTAVPSAIIRAPHLPLRRGRCAEARPGAGAGGPRGSAEAKGGEQRGREDGHAAHWAPGRAPAARKRRRDRRRGRRSRPPSRGRGCRESARPGPPARRRRSGSARFPPIAPALVLARALADSAAVSYKAVSVRTRARARDKARTLPRPLDLASRRNAAPKRGGGPQSTAGVDAAQERARRPRSTGRDRDRPARVCDEGKCGSKARRLRIQGAEEWEEVWVFRRPLSKAKLVRAGDGVGAAHLQLAYAGPAVAQSGQGRRVVAVGHAPCKDLRAAVSLGRVRG